MLIKYISLSSAFLFIFGDLLSKRALFVPLSHWAQFVSPIKQWAALQKRVESLSQCLILINFPSWWKSEDDRQFRGLPKCQTYNHSWFYVILSWVGFFLPCSDDHRVSSSNVRKCPCVNEQVRAAAHPATYRTLQLQSNAIKTLNEAWCLKNTQLTPPGNGNVLSPD